MNKNDDQFALARVTAKLMSLINGDEPEGSNLPEIRKATKSPFDDKYRKHRKIRTRMAKASRRINRK